MKANEFVKQHGWDKANKLVQGLVREVYGNGVLIKPMITLDGGETFINYGELKRLVESWELVEKLGGLENAKIELKSVDYNSEKDFYDNLKQAILDVESCQ